MFEGALFALFHKTLFFSVAQFGATWVRSCAQHASCHRHRKHDAKCLQQTLSKSVATTKSWMRSSEFEWTICWTATDSMPRCVTRPSKRVRHYSRLTQWFAGDRCKPEAATFLPASDSCCALLELCFEYPKYWSWTRFVWDSSPQQSNK